MGEDTLEYIKLLIEEVHTLDDIVQETGYTKRKLNNLFRQYPEIVLHWVLKQMRNSPENEKKASISTILQETGLGEEAVGRAVEEEIEVGTYRVKLKEFLYDNFVLQGIPLREIKKVLGKNNHQRVQQYLKATGQHEKN